MASSDLAPDPPHNLPGSKRLPVEIAAYVRLSFSEEVELNGWVGELTMTGDSRRRHRHLDVTTQLDGTSCHLRYNLRRMRPTTVTGEVMGQPVSGRALVTNGGVDFDGTAGLEPLQYRIDSAGGCTMFGYDLGIRVTFQSFYSEIRGTVERAPDAVMVGLLLPMLVRRRANALDPT